MNEDLLYFVWKYKLFNDFVLFNIERNGFEILNQGAQNSNAGPDFLGAKIKTNEAMWVGNVEIHVRSSDWDLHKHHLDKAYNNVVLQVVKIHDKDVYTEDGRLVPVMEIPVAAEVEKKYGEFLESKNKIPCEKDILQVDTFKLNIWLGNVLVERLNKKSGQILHILAQNNNSWEETFYHLLARSFGLKVNAEPFEWLAKSIPLKFLGKHKDKLIQVEALLFGQAGFLDGVDNEGDYYLKLKREYSFLKTKFKLKPIEKHLWKFLRLRPSNFPHVRIAQFAALVHKSRSLFSKVLEAKSLDELVRLFKVQASSFWDNGYTFEKTSTKRKKVLGKSAVNLILINAVIPVLFVYGKYTDDEGVKQRALDYLEELGPEKNRVIESWKDAGVDVPSAFYSQALLEQTKSYCEPTKCLNCGIAIEIFKNRT